MNHRKTVIGLGFCLSVMSAATIAEAEEQLGEVVSVYLDGGPIAAATPSTIVDVTAEVPRVLRAGAVSLERLRAVLPEISA